MSDRDLSGEMVKALRAGMGRLGEQRAKLEKIQRMRQALEELGMTSGRRPADACESA